MQLLQSAKNKTQTISLRYVSGFVIFVGLLLISEVLLDGVTQIHSIAQDIIPIEYVLTVPLSAGLLFVYLGLLLQRRKRSAWYVAIILFASYFAVSLATLNIADLLLASIGLFVLTKYKSEFVVKSGISNFSISFRNAGIIVAIMLVYGVLGFLLLDTSAFGVEMTPAQALQSTIDPFGLFSEQLAPQNLSGKIFLDSVFFMAFMTIAYVMVSFFGPIKQILVDQSHNKAILEDLLNKYSHDSEDYFKLWPHDKQYFTYNKAALAYKLIGGTALVAGDPVGKTSDIKILLINFIEQCRINDWKVAFIHTEKRYVQLYREQKLDIQKIGEEAIINVRTFCEHTSRNKHFRNVNNRFTKAAYTVEFLSPPYSDAFMTALHRVSDSWLKLPGKSERGFMLGYFDEQYLQQCPILVVKDDAGQIISFINQVPSYAHNEANIDLMRHMADAPPNVNDFMFLHYIKHSQELGCDYVNLGLCPLVGIDDSDESARVITNLLKFVYANGSRFFGFEGLARFKNKFEPEWRNRYVVYQDGIVGFTRAMNALNRAMRIKK